MKWRNHAIMAGSIAIMLHLHPAEIAVCVAGASLPDQMEQIGRVRIIPHRTLTHELLLWLVPLVVFFYFPHLVAVVPPKLAPLGALLPGEAYRVRTGVLFLPGILHLAGDAMTPRGIRVAGQKVSLRLFTTGHPLEYVATAVFVLAALWLR